MSCSGSMSSPNMPVVYTILVGSWHITCTLSLTLDRDGDKGVNVVVWVLQPDLLNGDVDVSVSGEELWALHKSAS